MRILQRLGDVSLFVAGFFAHGFERRLIDVDYHIAMGGRAYGTLATCISGPRRALADVFGELARKFQRVVDAVGEIARFRARLVAEGCAAALRGVAQDRQSTGAGAARQLGVAPAPVSLRAS